MDKGRDPSLALEFPFSAITGQEKGKKALLCAIANRSIKSVLIIGKTGTAKSTLVRSIVKLFPNRKSIIVPLNVTEERIIGSIDMESALLSGETKLLPGLLEEADNGILIADQINLLDESIINLILEVNDSGMNIVEREGISGVFSCDFLLLATMNPEEGEISSHSIDRFDLCVELDTINNIEARRSILANAYKFEQNRVSFVNRYNEEELKLQEVVEKARKLIPYVYISDGHLELISRLSLELGIQSHRGDIALANVSKAIAALNGRDVVLIEDLQEGASLALDHRRINSDVPSPSQGQANRTDSREPGEITKGDSDADFGEMENSDRDNPKDDLSSDYQDISKVPKGDERETVFGVSDPFIVVDFLGKRPGIKRRYSNKLGRREEIISTNRSGRYVSFRFPTGSIKDLAFDASLRAAAPYQNYRDKNDLAIRLYSSDLREKVRVRKRGTTLLFLVDGSGSMGYRQRMSAVKGTILSLLDDAYKKRDAVGMMVFRGESAELLLPPTRSTDLAFRKLKDLPTGGRTPLPFGLAKAVNFIITWKIRYPEEDPVLIIVSDCRANYSKTGGNAFKESLQIAEQVSHEQIRYIVVDTEIDYPRMNLSEKLCRALKGSYFRLEDINADSLAKSVKAVIRS